MILYHVYNLKIFHATMMIEELKFIYYLGLPTIITSTLFSLQMLIIS